MNCVGGGKDWMYSEHGGLDGRQNHLVADAAVDLLKMGKETLNVGGRRRSSGVEAELVGGVGNVDDRAVVALEAVAALDIAGSTNLLALDTVISGEAVKDLVLRSEAALQKRVK